MSHTTVHAARRSQRIDYVFIHEDYNYLTHDFDIAILELSSPHRFFRPVTLPFSAPAREFGKSSTTIDAQIAVANGNSLRPMYATFWPNDQCTQTKLYPHPHNENTLLCVENPCSDECEVRFRINRKHFSKTFR